MARIRSIHPGLFTDEDYMSLSPYAMAAWPGIWVEADDQGVFEWKPLTLKARLLPCASVDMTAILAEYEERGMVRRFEVDGKAYGAIRNFRKFQRPEKPKAWHPLPDVLRSFVGLSPTNPQPVADQSPTAPRKSPQMEDGGWRMEGGEGGSTPPSPPCDAEQAVALWNALADECGLPRVQKLTKTRQASLKARLRDCGGLDGWRTALDRIRGSPGLCGANDRGWKADFDFLVSEKKFTRLMEGKYDQWGNGGGGRIVPLHGEHKPSAHEALYSAAAQAGGVGRH